MMGGTCTVFMRARAIVIRIGDSDSLQLFLAKSKFFMILEHTAYDTWYDVSNNVISLCRQEKMYDVISIIT